MVYFPLPVTQHGRKGLSLPLLVRRQDLGHFLLFEGYSVSTFEYRFEGDEPCKIGTAKDLKCRIGKTGRLV